MQTTHHCPLCQQTDDGVVWRGPLFRVIRADESGFPAFYRVVWNTHVAEFSDLTPEHRHLCMEAVNVVEQVLRAHLSPDKINLAALGNQVPHLHWHVIARFKWDSHFPGSVWAAAQRSNDATRLKEIAQKLPNLDQVIHSAMCQKFLDKLA